MEKKLKFIRILKFITISIYIISVNYYASDMIDHGIIKKNYIYIIGFSIVIMGGVIFLIRFFDKLLRKNT